MKTALWIIGGIVTLGILWIIIQPRPAYPYGYNPYGYAGNNWNNAGKLFGSALGSFAAAFGRQPATGAAVVGRGPTSIVWQPSQAQLAQSYNSISPGGGGVQSSVTGALTPGWGWEGNKDQTDIMNYRGSTAYPTRNNSADAQAGDIVDQLIP